jgi:hypothetical protein
LLLLLRDRRINLPFAARRLPSSAALGHVLKKLVEQPPVHRLIETPGVIADKLSADLRTSGYLQRSDEARLALVIGSYLCAAPDRQMPSSRFVLSVG